MARYPELTWTVNRDGADVAITQDFSLRCRLRTGGDSAGTWSAIMNNTSLTTGRGRFGYDFDDRQHAMIALEKAMRDTIDARIKYANQVLKAYA